MVVFNAKAVVGEKFHSAKIDTDEFKALIKDLMSDTHPGDEVLSIDINDSGLVDVKLASGEEVEIEVDWNEIILK